MNRKLVIENKVMENDIKNEIKVKTKYWHKCQGCSRRHSTKIKFKSNKMKSRIILNRKRTSYLSKAQWTNDKSKRKYKHMSVIPFPVCEYAAIH